MSCEQIEDQGAAKHFAVSFQLLLPPPPLDPETDMFPKLDELVSIA
jgi:hypothetical protein